MEFIDEVIVSNTRGSAPVEFGNCILDRIVQLLNQVAHDEEASTVVPIVAVDAD